jgi:hypothetical protein
MSIPTATAQRGGAVRSGVRGAVAGGIIGGDSGARTGAKAGVVVGATRSVVQGVEQRNAMNTETQARAQYQTTPAYANAQHSNFNEAPPDVIAGPAAVGSTPAGQEVVLRKDGKPVLGITYPTDWKQKVADNAVAAVSKDGHAWSAVAILDDVKDKDAGIDKIKQRLEKSLQDIKYDEATKTEGGAVVVTGTGKGKKSGIDLVFAIAALDSGKGQLVGAAFIVDHALDDQYKETIRYICHTVRHANDFTDKSGDPAQKTGTN